MRMRSQDLGVTPFFQGFNPAFQLPNSGKGKAREADFEAAFANAMASLNMNSENSKVFLPSHRKNTSHMFYITKFTNNRLFSFPSLLLIHGS